MQLNILHRKFIVFLYLIPVIIVGIIFITYPKTEEFPLFLLFIIPIGWIFIFFRTIFEVKGQLETYNYFMNIPSEKYDEFLYEDFLSAGLFALTSEENKKWEQKFKEVQKIVYAKDTDRETLLKLKERYET